MAQKRERTERATAYQVRVLDRAIDILDAFSVTKSDLTMREIVEATGLNRSTAIRLVANLERRGLLQQSPTPGRYRLGHRLFQMGTIVYSSFSLLDAAAAPIDALQRLSGATIILAVRNGDYCVTVDKRLGLGDGSAMVTMPDEIGTVRPLTYGPIGQVFLSLLTQEEAEDLLDRYPLVQRTPYSVLDHQTFLERLPRVREEGYAVEVNEVVEGLMGIATPIFDFAGNLAGVLSLAFPATRETDTTFLDEAVRNLKQAATEVSANLGYSGHAEEEGE
jgi:DNA-binding IclR family transcriptional regulator